MALFRRTTAGTRPRVALPLAAKCGLCRLDKSGCQTPKMAPTGEGRRRILVIGEAPGEEEDRRGRQFVGKTGMFLRDVLKECGLEPDRDCVFENAVRCRPPRNKIKDELCIDHCRPNVLKTIDQYDPAVIILLGARAVRSVVGHLVGDDPKGVRRWAGFQIPAQRPNAWVCPTYHPSFVMREERSNVYPVIEQAFKDHIRAAVRLRSKPWEKVPDYAKEVTVETDHRVAAEYLQAFLANGEPVAFDFETNMLKPDSRRSRIVTCAVSDGATTVAYPWHGRAVKATAALLRSKVVKVGYNLKFEDRWCRAKLGFHVRNFRHCGMITAHGFDCRPGVTSAKFQAFVLLGQGDYSSSIKPYLVSKEDGGYAENRIAEAPLHDLLLYNGMDALLEYHIWERQTKRFV